MLRSGLAKLLSIYVNEGDKWHHEPLFLALMARARQAGLAGVTLLHTEGGVGGHGHVHSAMSDYLMVSMPVVVQIVDTPEAIEAFLPAVHEMVPEGLITVADVQVVRAGQPPLGATPRTTVEHLMSPRMAVVSPETPVKALAERLMAEASRYLYVVDGDGRLMGVVGRRDLLQQVLSPHPSALALLADRLPGADGELHHRIEQAHAFTAEQVMVAEVRSVAPEAPLEDAVRLMVEKGFLEVPVVREGRLVGTITQQEVLRRQLGL